MLVDIHSHILPGVDDGADSLLTAQRMIEFSYTEGCTHLFLTPHAYSLNDRHIDVYDLYDKLLCWLDTKKANMKLYLGSEIYVDPEVENIKSIIKKLKKQKYLTLGDSNLVLIEFYLGGFKLEDIAPSIAALTDAGYKPVIAHAERYGVPFEYLCELKEMGCLLQMNLCDLYFKWMDDVNIMTKKLLDSQMFDFIGTDAHDLGRRPPVIAEYVDYLYKHYDNNYIDDILYNNAAYKYLSLEDH